MIIENSNLQITCTHHLSHKESEKILRRETVLDSKSEAIGKLGDRNKTQVTELPENTVDERPVISITQTAKALSIAHTAAQSTAEILDTESSEYDHENKVKLQVLLRTIEKMTGKSFHISETRFTRPKQVSPAEMENLNAIAQGDIETGPNFLDADTPDNRIRKTETYTERYYHEVEETSFSATGIITTADGKEITIAVGVTMARSFFEAHADYTVSFGPVTDPLVINWEGNAADLTDTKFAFDLKGDHQQEQISFVKPGSGGFLAYDKNKDGVINNGGELFGPTSGNGFSELSAYDQDQNGWIDEKDAVYYDLSVWSKSNSGQDYLVALVDTGVGAIYLNDIDTPFRVTTSQNETLGQVQRTSVYLKEDGSAGTIQQIDLAT